MQFHDKLHFLMNLTGTSNSALAQAAILDASYISRLRRGERQPVKDAAYLENIAAYLTRQCSKEYQKKALLEAMQSSGYLQNSDITIDSIHRWLLDSCNIENNVIDELLDGMLKVSFKKPVSPELPYHKEAAAQSDVSFFYGNQGKRDAVLAFLSMVLESPQKVTLLLYSDESIDWLTEDLAFQATWANMMTRIVMQGHHIKMIHTINRDLDEMLEGLAKWMPLYMTAAIEPYYYPRKRDGVFKRTLFVAIGLAAITSSSTDNMHSKAVNVLLKDKQVIATLADEYNGYLQLCKPLMRIFPPDRGLDFLATLKEFENESANAFVKAGFLSLATMPPTVAATIFERIDETNKKAIIDYYSQRKANFEKQLDQYHFYEIVQLPDIKNIKDGKAEVGFAGLKQTPQVYYQPEEFRLHLENIIQLLHHHDNYQFLISNEIQHYEYRLYIKEDLGGIIIKTTTPQIIFAVNESNITAAFWDYMNLAYKENQTDKKEIIQKLQNLADALRD